MRTKKEISAAIDEFFDLVSYERKLVLFLEIQDGTEEMPGKETYDKIIKHRERVRKQRNYTGVKDDFEWGMINGKLSALRWIMGYDWDFLDT